MILTVDRRFKIYNRHRRKWSVVQDLSQTLYQHLKSRPTDRLVSASSTVSASEAMVRNLVTKCYSLATNCWTWSGDSGHSDPTLYTGQMSGHIVRYCYSSTSQQFSVKQVYKTEMKEISCIEYYTVDNVEILLVAGNDGRVEVVKILKDKLKSLGMLWADPDRLVVNNFVCHLSEDGQTTVFIAKANFCIQIKLSIVSNGSKLQMGSPVSLNTGMTRIVGMLRIGDSLVLTNQKCVVRSCDLSRVSSSRLVSLEVVREHYMCQGMVASVNGSVIACVDNISSFHDHLIAREPSRLVFFTLETASSLLSKMCRRQDELSQCADILDCYKCLVTNDSELSASSDIAPSVLWWHHKVQAHKNGENSMENVMNCEARLRCQAARNNIVSNSQANVRSASTNFLFKFSDGHRRMEDHWQCRICQAGESGETSDVSRVTCQSGHTWPRCPDTQLPVDTSRPSRCCWCKSLTLSITDNCSLCQGPLLHSNQ